jgi:hypothetical protein
VRSRCTSARASAGSNGETVRPVGPVWCSRSPSCRRGRRVVPRARPLHPTSTQRSNECVSLTGPLCGTWPPARRRACGQPPTSSVDDEIALGLCQPTSDVDQVGIRFLRCRPSATAADPSVATGEKTWPYITFKNAKFGGTPHIRVLRRDRQQLRRLGSQTQDQVAQLLAVPPNCSHSTRHLSRCAILASREPAGFRVLMSS